MIVTIQNPRLLQSARPEASRAGWGLTLGTSNSKGKLVVRYVNPQGRAEQLPWSEPLLHPFAEADASLIGDFMAGKRFGMSVQKSRVAFVVMAQTAVAQVTCKGIGSIVMLRRDKPPEKI